MNLIIYHSNVFLFLNKTKRVHFQQSFKGHLRFTVVPHLCDLWTEEEEGKQKGMFTRKHFKATVPAVNKINV